MHRYNRVATSCFSALLMLGVATLALPVSGAEIAPKTVQSSPWMNRSLTPDQRADLILSQMTQAEKLRIVHGIMPVKIKRLMAKRPTPKEAIGSSGYVPGVPRLGIPALQETDAGQGVANPHDARPGDVATALPAGIVTASSFNPDIAYLGGKVMAHEAFSKGLNVQLAGGMNLARDPRNGRNFEYLGEDLLLAGMMDGAIIRGIQSQHVVSTIKHFAVNGQETDRKHANSIISEKGMRESDLLAFEIGIEQGHPGSVMCGYNLVNGVYDCGNGHLQNDILKHDWKYPGWVMSDWGATHAVDYAVKGLDQESGAGLDNEMYFADPLKKAVASGKVPEARLDDMARRILRSMFAVGLFDYPAKKAPIDFSVGKKAALDGAEAGIVLLKNSGHILPLAAHAQKIAVIGGHADYGVLSGGGSSQVVPPGSLVYKLGHNAVENMLGRKVWHPSSPLAAIRKLAPQAQVRYADGQYTSEAVDLAKWADVVIVIGEKWQREAQDVPDLTLPHGQNALISAVTRANPRSVVVLETGNPVTMPWLKQASAVVEAWYPGESGGEAIANVLFGKVNPAGHLPITFPASLKQLPRQKIPGYGKAILNPRDYSAGRALAVHYTEGSDVGYRWYAKHHFTPLFPFGYGLSYTKFGYGNLHVTGGKTVTASFDVTNTGKRAGRAVPQLYLANAGGEKVLRLIGFSSVALKPGETRHVTFTADRRLLADYSVKAHGWKIKGGHYEVKLSRSATDPVQSASVVVSAATLAP